MRFRSSAPRPARRPDRHGRHGRAGRSSVVRPPLPPLESRIDAFDLALGAAVEYLRTGWPELRDVRIEIGSLPPQANRDGIPRWHVDSERGRIILYRVAIERLLPPGHDDAAHRRLAAETAIFHAAAEYTGLDPWEFSPDH